MASRFSGSVIKKPFGGSSKSKHDAVWLVTDKREYVLRRPQGNPFHDPELEKLVGKRIDCNGTPHGYLLLISDWTEARS